MTGNELITIFTALGFGPGLAIVLLRWVLARSKKQDDRVDLQAAELAQVRARLDTLEEQSRTLLTNRLRESTAAEERLATAVDDVVHSAAKLANVVTAIESRLEIRPCQLPAPILAVIRRMLNTGETAQEALG